MNLRLQHGGAYTSDIESIRTAIRANGTQRNAGTITISHPQTAFKVDLTIFLAYESNRNLPAAPSSLYTIGFKNNAAAAAAPIWHFNIAVPLAVPLAAANLLPGGITGSYQSLGYANNLPTITDANLAVSLHNVAVYSGGPLVPGGAAGGAVLDGLARLIIACNEAIRFSDVENGIDNVLGDTNPPNNPKTYPLTNPLEMVRVTNLVHNWDSYGLGRG